MTLELFERLLAEPAVLDAASELAPSDATFLAAYEKLRKRFDADLAKAALETAILREKARAKFPDAGRLFFEREALEQASHHLVAAHRAKRFKRFKTVLDLGCGLGADAIALARAGCEVIAVERDSLRARLAEANFTALGLNVRVVRADALTAELPPCDALFCDPARRDAAGRHLAIDRYSPSPREVLARFLGVPVGFKLAPGLDRMDAASLGGELEFVSLAGELKEARVWLNGLETCIRRATILPDGDTLDGSADWISRHVREPGAVIYLPDSAVVRAELEGVLAGRLNAGFLDDRHPLLTADTWVATPLAEAFRFDGLITGSVKHLSAALRERGVGRVTWRNIGSPRDVESVRRGVKLAGDGHRTVILTELGEHAAALIVSRVED